MPLPIQQEPMLYSENLALIFFIHIRKKEPVTSFRLNSFLYRGSLTGKF